METFFKKFKHISAFIAVIIILLLYITTLVLAIMNNSYTKRFFYASLFSSVFLPVMLYLMMWIAKVFRSYNPNLKENALSNDVKKERSDMIDINETNED